MTITTITFDNSRQEERLGNSEIHLFNVFYLFMELKKPAITKLLLDRGLHLSVSVDSVITLVFFGGWSSCQWVAASLQRIVVKPMIQVF